MKKEIVFCTDSLNIGGIELALIRVLKALIKTKKYNIKLCIKDDEKLELLSEIPKEIELLILDKKEEYKYVFGFMKKIFIKNKFYNFIKNSDTIIDYYDGNWFKLFSSIKDKKKIVFFHTILEKLHIYKKIDIVKNVYDKYVVLTDGAKDELLARGIKKEKVCKIYNIIPIKEVLEKSTEKFLDKNDYFVMIGRLVNDSKDYETVIEAFKDNEIKDELYIVGDGPHRNNLEKKINELKLESKIKLLGSKQNPYPILKHSKGLILSSRYEGLSNVILEALTLEKSVIASSCPYGPKEILGESSEIGFIFPVGDKEKLVALLKEIDSKSFNLEKMRKRVEDFSEEKIIKKLMLLIEEAN